MNRLLSSLCLALLLPAPGLQAQDELPIDPEQLEQLQQQLSSGPGSGPEELIPPQEPMSPREELFMAIELRDVEAARRALEGGADGEINVGSPGALATAALYNDLRMVALLLDFGGDPGADRDGALEEAIRHENTRMVELLMRAGARLPSAASAGRQLFGLAQRGGEARDLSRILLDHGADPDLCLAAATAESRIDLMKYCLSRGAGADNLPAELNALRVALASGDSEIVDRILEQGPDDALVAGAMLEAVAAGRMDLVRQAVAGGVPPAFPHVEAAVENGRTEIGLFLLEQATSDDTWLDDGNVEDLMQRAGDLGLDQLAAELKRRSGLSIWSAKPWLPLLASVVVAAVLGGLLLNRLIARRRPAARAAAAAAAVPPAARPPDPAAVAGARPAPMAPAVPATPRPKVPVAVPAAVPLPPAAVPPAVVPALPDANAAATIPVGSLQTPLAAPPVPAPAPPAPSAGGFAAAPAPVVAGEGGNAWQLVPEPVAEARPVEAPAVEAAAVPAAAVPGVPAVEVRMPDVDLSRDAAAVFTAARQASSGETVRPDAPDRRQVVLVTPARATMLHSCPAAGSLAPQELAAAERIAPAATPRNVAVIAYTDLDPMSAEIQAAIPFFDLLKRLGYLGHAVWIFEGHVSAMAAGCQDADVLIVDDGMMPYLPGNWRSVATRSMRGSEIHVFERKTGVLRRLG